MTGKDPDRTTRRNPTAPCFSSLPYLAVHGPLSLLDVVVIMMNLAVCPRITESAAHSTSPSPLFFPGPRIMILAASAYGGVITAAAAAAAAPTWRRPTQRPPCPRRNGRRCRPRLTE